MHPCRPRAEWRALPATIRGGLSVRRTIRRRNAAGAGGRLGWRAVPSLMYTQNIPPSPEHYFDDEGDDSIDQGPAGGRTWDGRAQTVHDQARLPLLSPREMANASPDAVVERLRRASYARTFREVFGASALDDPVTAFNAALLALEVF